MNSWWRDVVVDTGSKSREFHPEQCYK